MPGTAQALCSEPRREHCCELPQCVLHSYPGPFDVPPYLLLGAKDVWLEKQLQTGDLDLPRRAPRPQRDRGLGPSAGGSLLRASTEVAARGGPMLSSGGK